jgi:hypothetical protein
MQEQKSRQPMRREAKYQNAYLVEIGGGIFCLGVLITVFGIDIYVAESSLKCMLLTYK